MTACWSSGLTAPAGHMDEAEELTQSVRDSISIH